MKLASIFLGSLLTGCFSVSVPSSSAPAPESESPAIAEPVAPPAAPPSMRAPFGGTPTPPSPPPAGCPTDSFTAGEFVTDLSVVATLPAGTRLSITDGNLPVGHGGPTLDLKPGTYYVSLVGDNDVGLGEAAPIAIPSSHWFDHGTIVCRARIGTLARPTCTVHSLGDMHGSTPGDGIYVMDSDGGDAAGAASLAIHAEYGAGVELTMGALVVTAPAGDSTTHDMSSGDYYTELLSPPGAGTGSATVVHVPRDARFAGGSLHCDYGSPFANTTCTLRSADGKLASTTLDGVVKRCL